MWGVVSKFGIIGVMAVGFLGYAFWLSPQQQQRFHEELKAEREANREDIGKSREHGNKAAKELGDAIREQTQAIREQTRNQDFYSTLLGHTMEQQLETQKKTYLKMLPMDKKKVE